MDGEVAPLPALSTGWSSDVQEAQQADAGAVPQRSAAHALPGRKPVILVFNKWDLSGQPPFVAKVRAKESHRSVL